MGDKTKIEWTDATWNWLRGCTRASSGCINCYAERISANHSGPGEPYSPVIRDGKWTNTVITVDHKMDEPLKWERPRMIFVNSMSDTFHPTVEDLTLTLAFNVMRKAQHHAFQVLTKRPERMATFMRDVYPGRVDLSKTVWPPPNIWLGTSVENQAAVAHRTTHLMNTPGRVRFLSVEPLLGSVRLALRMDPYGYNVTGAKSLWCDEDGTIDWVIVGAESGPGARPMELDWVRAIRDQCVEIGVPFFFKQLVDDGKKQVLPELDGKVWNQMPEWKPETKQPELPLK